MDESLLLDETLRTDLSVLKLGIKDLGVDFLANSNLPIFSYLCTVYSTANVLIRNFEMKKLYGYLLFVKDTPLNERVKFLDKINSRKDLCSSFSEMTISVLQKADDIIKSKVIGFVTRQMILGSIDNTIGIRAIRVIEKILYQDLLFLMNNPISEWNKNQIIVDSLATTGILTSWQIMVPSEHGFPMNYIVNEFGSMFKQILDDYKLLGEGA